MYPDLTNTTIFSQAGAAMAQYEINDPTTGLGAGPTGSIAPGSGRGMGRYIAVKSAAGQNPQPRVVTASGDNGRFLQPYVFNPAEPGVVNLAFGAFNMNAYAAFSKTKIRTIGDGAGVGIQTNQPANARQATLLLTADAQDADALVFGEARFINYFYPQLSVWLLGEQMNEVQAADFGYVGVPTSASRMPWGIAFSDDIDGFTRSKAYKTVTRYPVTLHRYRVTGTSSTVTFTLDASPTTDQTGPAIKAFRYVAATGVAEEATLTSVVVGARQVVVAPLSGNFADGDWVTVYYESFDIMAVN